VSAGFRALKWPFFRAYSGGKPNALQPGDEDWEAVSFYNGSRQGLRGLFGAATNRPAKAAVVLAHPMTRAAKCFFLKSGVARRLRQHGLDVLLFDFNGFGESESSNFDYPSDLIAAGNYLRYRSQAGTLGVLGVSFGAAWALCALSQEAHPFEAVVLDSPFAHLEEYWANFLFPYVMLKAISRILPDLSTYLRPSNQAKLANRVKRALFIYGTDDDVTPPSVGSRLLQSLKASPASREGLSCSLWIVDGASHTKSAHADVAAYCDRVVATLFVA
jgi:pimeloyl-ACP methyl ester carboxylesterase